MKTRETGDCEKGEGASKPIGVGIFVHEDGNRQCNGQVEESGYLGMWEGKRDKHDFPCMVVINHTITQELKDSRNDGWADSS